MSIKALLIILAIVLVVLGCWIHWECVVKPLKSMNPKAWSRDFPTPFYIIYLPIWLWHDLAYTLIIIGTIILGYYAVKSMKYEGIEHEHIHS